MSWQWRTRLHAPGRRAVGGCILAVLVTVAVAGGWCDRGCRAQGFSAAVHDPPGAAEGAGSEALADGLSPSGESAVPAPGGPVVTCVERQGRLYVPVRPLAETFGWFVQLQADGATVTVDGFPLRAVVAGGRSLVQARELATLMGLVLTWDESRHVAVLRGDAGMAILAPVVGGSDQARLTQVTATPGPPAPLGAGAAAVVEGTTSNRDVLRQEGSSVESAPVRGMLALTFDDGPQPAAVHALLDVLADYDAKATFFLVGQLVEAYPELVLAIDKAGHEIGNHSYSHRHLSGLTDDLVRVEIARTQEAVRAITGKSPTVFRPPYGDYDDRVRRIAAEQGCRMVLWDVNSDDWNDPDPRAIVEKVVRRARNGCVVLLHTRVSTSRILAAIMDGLLQRNLLPVRLEELSPAKAAWSSGLAGP